MSWRTARSMTAKAPTNVEDVYEQEFMVGDVVYVATLKCEYNRHDKRYYYLDGQEFSITPKASA